MYRKHLGLILNVLVPFFCNHDKEENLMLLDSFTFNKKVLRYLPYVC